VSLNKWVTLQIASVNSASHAGDMLDIVRMGTFSKGKLFPRKTSLMWVISRLYAAQKCRAEGILLQPPRLRTLPKNKSKWSWLHLDEHRKRIPNRPEETKYWYSDSRVWADCQYTQQIQENQFSDLNSKYVFHLVTLSMKKCMP